MPKKTFVSRKEVETTLLKTINKDKKNPKNVFEDWTDQELHNYLEAASKSFRETKKQNVMVKLRARPVQPKKNWHTCQYCKKYKGTSFNVGIHLWEKHLNEITTCPICGEKKVFIRKHIHCHDVCLVCLKYADFKNKGKNCNYICEDEFMTKTLDEYHRRAKVLREKKQKELETKKQVKESSPN